LSDVPENGFTSRYYDRDYFASEKGKAYRRQANGRTERWGYYNPEGEWQGAMYIVDTWVQMFNPRTMLDFGCGRGTMITYAHDFGINAVGFDFSEWAIEHRYPRCDPSWIIQHDATKKWPYPDEGFDLVTGLDIMEHLYEDDLAVTIDELRRVAGKWIFLQIATVDGVREKGYTLKRDEPVPIDVEVYAVAGHVNVRTEKYWIDKLQNNEWKVRIDLKDRFFDLTEPSVVTNWKLNTVIVLERKDEAL
jgi:SAM-dependent methyltransferase